MRHRGKRTRVGALLSRVQWVLFTMILKRIRSLFLDPFRIIAGVVKRDLLLVWEHHFRLTRTRSRGTGEVRDRACTWISVPVRRVPIVGIVTDGVDTSVRGSIDKGTLGVARGTARAVVVRRELFVTIGDCNVAFQWTSCTTQGIAAFGTARRWNGVRRIAPNGHGRVCSCKVLKRKGRSCKEEMERGANTNHRV